MNVSPGRILFTFTTSQSIIFVRRFTCYLRERGWHVGIASEDGPELAEAADSGVDVFPMSWSRTSSPGTDLRGVAQLRRAVRRFRPTIIHSSTVKAGALSMIATMGVPAHRLYHMRGLPMETASGLTRTQLWAAEVTACMLADRVICVSGSLRDRAIQLGVRGAQKAVVLGRGSGQGVDTVRFDPDASAPPASTALRGELGIPEQACVFGFVGRFAVDKGIRELAAAWPHVISKAPDARLLLVGDEDARQAAREDLARLKASHGVHFTSWQDDMPRAYRAMDVVVLPTYREGLPNVLLEAGAMRLPCVTTRVTGCVDVVADEENGLLIPAADASALVRSMLRYANDPESIAIHGREARHRVCRDFDQTLVWRNLERFYLDLS